MLFLKHAAVQPLIKKKTWSLLSCQISDQSPNCHSCPRFWRKWFLTSSGHPWWHMTVSKSLTAPWNHAASPKLWSVTLPLWFCWSWRLLSTPWITWSQCALESIWRFYGLSLKQLSIELDSRSATTGCPSDWAEGQRRPNVWGLQEMPALPHQSGSTPSEVFKSCLKTHFLSLVFNHPAFSSYSNLYLITLLLLYCPWCIL